MNSIKLIIPSAIIIALASCAAKKDDYDTSSPYGPADASANAAPYQPVAPTNQTYDTPAAYEDAGSAAVTPNAPVPTPSEAAAAPSPAATGAVTATHTVVKGDTLGGIAKKYKVSTASIKAANGMTSDVVVLGKKLKIPAN